MLDTRQRGEIAFLKVCLVAANKGYIVSKPTTETRYDAILDVAGKLQRVQVKYSNDVANGAVTIALRRRNTSSVGKYRPYTAEEIDLVLSYVPTIDKVLCFGPEYFDGRPAITVRLEPAKNGQKSGVILATDHIWE